MEAAEPSQEHLEGFTLTLAVTEGVGAVAVILVIIWLGHYHGGFTWSSNPKVQFNWHPVLLVTGLIFLYANGILVYRAFRTTRKHRLKLFHMGVHGLAFILAVIGLKAVFDSHNLVSPPVPNMYSLHSWIGLSAVILFCCQWVTGFITFLLPGLHSTYRSAYMPVHVFFGLGSFVLAVTAALLGTLEKANWAIPDIANLPPEAILVNFFGISLVIFAGLVIYLTTESRFKRLPQPEDKLLLSSAASTDQ